MMLLLACSKEDDNIASQTKSTNINNTTRNYSNEKGVTLQLTNSTWFTEKENGFGYVNLTISGSTNADKVIVMTSGDGLISEYNILLDSNKKFTNDTIGISFTHAPSADEFETSTKIKAINGSDTLVVTLTSGKLHY